MFDHDALTNNLSTDVFHQEVQQLDEILRYAKGKEEVVQAKYLESQMLVDVD